ncbi:hypothetical protein [Streptomyces sparsogenes]|uniref:Uncharacterized protein n=1 Tax=Streptomyces sparsogenes DSM 40356 TaxID=1331668 RepID=A0A1R1SU29_9ACTN|nr:hypothetical protein [Streptomyces sparsogenes]OMI41559.1 hypothetical protein SPAR_00180 [Streptomyces sparsogenes DSM 40356]
MRDTDNVELRAAWATVPDVAKAEDRHAAILELKRAFKRPADPERARREVIDDAIASFRVSGKWPADLGSRAAKAYFEALEGQSEYIALVEGERLLKHEKEDLRDTLSDDALAYLGRRLADVLSDAKTAGAALDGVRNADEAIQAGGGALEAFRTLTALLKDFENIRAAQWSVLTSVADEDTRAKLRNWKRQGHGEVAGFRPDDVPPFALEAMQTQRYTVPYLVWAANIGTSYVPASLDDLEADVSAATEPTAYDDSGPIRDFSPIEVPIPDAPEAKRYAHSRPAHLDHSTPAPRPIKPNATPGDPAPLTYTY